MIPLRLVIDTNIIVSAALKPDGFRLFDEPVANGAFLPFLVMHFRMGARRVGDDIV